MTAREPTALPERNLDILRSTAVLSVFGCHLGMALVPDGPSSPLLSALGSAGVSLFFVHTALVLMASLERGGRGKGWVGRFYLRRAARVYPLAMATVLLVVVAHVPPGAVVRGPLIATPAASPAEFWSSLFLVQNLFAVRPVLAPLWSLPIEVQMYVLLPVHHLVATRGGRRGMLALMLASLAAPLLLAVHIVPGAGRLGVLFYAPCFYGGVLAFWILRTRPAARWQSAWLVPITFASFALGAVAEPHVGSYLAGAVSCLLIGAMLPRVAESIPSALTRGARVVARYSYGIYLLHVPAIWLAFNVMDGEPLMVQLLVLVGSLGVLTRIGYHVIEQPAIRFAKRVANAEERGGQVGTLRQAGETT